MIFFYKITNFQFWLFCQSRFFKDNLSFNDFSIICHLFWSAANQGYLSSSITLFELLTYVPVLRAIWDGISPFITTFINILEMRHHATFLLAKMYDSALKAYLQLRTMADNKLLIYSQDKQLSVQDWSLPNFCAFWL